MRFFVSPSCGHFSKTEFIMGESVACESEFSLMQRFGKRLQENLNERRIPALLLDVSSKPGLTHKQRFDQGNNAFVLMIGLEKSPKRLAMSNVMTVRHSKVRKEVLDALVGPFTAWSRACALEMPCQVIFEEFRFESQSSVMQILPFRFQEHREVLFAQRLDSLAQLLAESVAKYFPQNLADRALQSVPKDVVSSSPAK